jgi:hypothetical protein
MNLKKIIEMGGSVVPLTEGKRSINGWNKYSTTQSTIEDLETWKNSGYESFGLLMGIGDFRVLDFDFKNAPDIEAETVFKEIFDSIPDQVKAKVMIQKTMNNGYHIIYRCNTTLKREILLKHPVTQKTILERIGPKNYIVILHKAYKVIHGSIEDAAYLSEDEEAMLSDISTQKIEELLVLNYELKNLKMIQKKNFIDINNQGASTDILTNHDSYIVRLAQYLDDKKIVTG